jgi:hypothetical protein
MRTEILTIVAFMGLLPCAGRAQEAGSVACPSIDNDQERLACYDRSLRGAPRAPSPTAAPAPSVQAPPPAPTVAPAASAPVAAAPTGTGAVSAAATTTAVTASAASQASAAGAGSTAAATPSSTVSTAPHTARNKHAGSPPSPDAPPTLNPYTGQPTGVMPIVVLSTLVRPGFPTEFTTDTAGVWVQTETKSLPNLPKAPFNAQLEPSKFGGSFLVVPDRKLGIRVSGPNR